MSMQPQEGQAPPLGALLAGVPPEERGPALRAFVEQVQARHRAGDLRAAELGYRSVLQVDPANADALHLLGLLAAQTGYLQDAVAMIGRAVELVADMPAFHTNLGNALRLLGRSEEAAASYGRAIALAPDAPAPHMNLATALKNLGRLEEAAAAAQRALALAPDSADTHFILGNILRRVEDLDGAAAAYRRALALDPSYLKAYQHLARILCNKGEHAAARDVVAEWLRFQPDDPTALHTLAALTGESAGPRASDGYIREHFDDFAESFDAQLLKKLDYRAPELAAAALRRRLGPPQGALDVLDAGCGTGLCGPMLRPYARRLTGIDLSPGMLARARARDLYDAIETAELTAFLGASPGRFDLIVSTDVLIYFGDLGPPLAAAAAALRPGGLLLFTLEHLEADGAAGFRLNPHGRYSHTDGHVRDRLAAAGFAAPEIGTAVLRTEGGEPVAGLVAAAARP